MRRMSSNPAAEGLRGLLIRDRLRSQQRWPLPPGQPDEVLEALRAGEAVGVDAPYLLRVLSRAGLPCDRFAYGGADWRKAYVLDGRGELSEVGGA